MTLKELQKLIAEGKVNFQKPEKPLPKQIQNDPLANFLLVLSLLRTPRQHLTSAPTFTPKNFAEQIQFYDDEAGSPTRRVYFYVNGGWRYITLT